MKVIRFIIFGFCLVPLSYLNAGELLYKVADIPKELKEKARAVIRNEEKIFEVTSISKGTLKVTYAITVLNKNGLDDANFTEFYDKFRTISAIKGRVFDEYGEQIKRIPSEDIQDFSAISGFSVFEDSRVKFIDPKIRNVPFTVEYSYEVTFNGLFQYPSWVPQPAYNLAVEKSSFKALIPENQDFRYLERSIPSSVKFTSDEKNKIYYWEASNLKAIEREPYSLPSEEIFPVVLMAPSAFEIGGFEGNANSWTGLGDWIYSINEGRDVLPEETVSFLKELTKDSGDDYGKIRKIYDYMQGRVRYVNVKTGIGGWQPIDALTVQRLCYGDCKALTNYMQSMLKAVSINSYYCLVSAGESAASLITSFPSSQFNHAFLCIPVGQDTLWLECTSQRLPCGYLSSFTDNRDVLLIDKAKSKIVRTRKYRLKDNLETSISHVRIDETGKGTLEINSVYKGLKYDEILSAFLADDIDKKKMISDKLKFPGFQVISFNYKENREIIPSIEESLIINFENYLTILNSKYLMPLNCTKKIANSPPNVRNRKTEVVVRHPFQDIDTIIYELSGTIKVESVPNPVHIVTPYGEYRANIELQENQLIYVRNFQINKGVYPAASYPDFIDFFDRITVTDDMKCILVKK